MKNITLADPTYYERPQIDLLLGADVFPYLLCDGKREGTKNEPVALSTIFGWILIGRIPHSKENITTTLCASLDDVNQSLQRFWEVEEIPTTKNQSSAGLKYEEIYNNTTTRQADGRYIVHFPFINNPPQIGQSREMIVREPYFSISY